MRYPQRQQQQSDAFMGPGVLKVRFTKEYTVAFIIARQQIFILQNSSFWK